MCVFCFPHSLTTAHCQGAGKFPASCPEGKLFTDLYFPEFAQVANQPLAGGWRGVLDGFHGDADYIHKTFRMKRRLASEHIGVCIDRCFPLARILGFEDLGMGRENISALIAKLCNGGMPTNPFLCCTPLLGRRPITGKRFLANIY